MVSNDGNDVIDGGPPVMGITFKANFLSYLVRSDMGVSQLREIQRKPVIRKTPEQGFCQRVTACRPFPIIPHFLKVSKSSSALFSVTKSV